MLELVVLIVKYHVNYLAKGEFIGWGVTVHPGRAVLGHPNRDRQLGDVPAGQ
ncbi:MAG TPA: hypothetical protein VMG13_26380 [Trebonia sp.]|nr:hypothetical protein [Trebonia sp.]